jgi:hypothetical protein
MKMQIPRNTPPANDPQELVRHFSATYFSLRLGLAILAFGFPFVLFAYGRLRHGLDLQPSMSAYFWAAAAADQCATFPMRTLFVGFLFAIGVGLYAYKGFTPLENVLLNVAGVCAAMVAIFPETIVPEDAKTDPRIDKLFQTCPAVKAWAEQDPMLIHYAAAVGLFVLLAIVSWRCAEKTLDYAPDTVDIDWFRRAYKIIAVGMLVFPLPGLAVAWALGLWDTHKVFFIEAAGVLTFGTYWAFKSRELWLSQPEKEPVKAVENARRRQQRKAEAAASKAAPTTAPPSD